MSVKNVVVTGGNNGIGLETVKGLYKDGHNIIFGSRNQAKNQEAIQNIKKDIPKSNGKIVSFKLDLSKLQSIENFAQFVKKNMEFIDILVNNAGLILNEQQMSELHCQMTMTINHLGHFYLTYLLLDCIKRSKQARIVNVSSTVHTNAVNDVTLSFNPQKFKSFQQYCDSKMANVLFTLGLSQLLQKYSHIKTMSLHPGAVQTGFGKQSSMIKFLKCCACCIFVNQERGSKTSLHLCRAPFKDLLSGEYYDDDTTHVEMDKRARNPEYVKKLWKKSQQILKINFEV